LKKKEGRDEKQGRGKKLEKKEQKFKEKTKRNHLKGLFSPII
jgi:hypothetical protein